MSQATTTSPQTADEQFAVKMTAVITGLMRFRGLDRHDVMRTLHISQGTYYKRLGDGHWTARQVQQLADLLQVAITDLYGDPAQLINPGSFLTLVAGDQAGSARKDRNTQGVLPFGRHLKVAPAPAAAKGGR